MDKKEIIRLYKEAVLLTRSEKPDERIAGRENMISLEDKAENEHGFDFWNELWILRKEWKK